MEGVHKESVTYKPAGTQVPIGGGAKGREAKESVSETMERTGAEVKKAIAHACDRTKDICVHWRHYPKMLTGLLLLASMLTGAGLMAGVQGVGWFGGGRHFLSSHWDRETADAHHALDVVLDHLKHPQYYQGEHAEGLVHKAKRTMYGLFEGIMPGRRTKSMGRGMYEGAEGLGEDLSYGARRGYEKVKDAGYELKDKMSDWGQTIKEKLTPGTDYGYEARKYGERLMGDSDRGRGGWFSGGSSWFGGKPKMRSRSEYEGGGGGGWFGGHGDQDEFDVASRKVKGVIREAERDM